MQKVKTFESNILLGGIMLILAHPADNHEAFPSTSHLDHEDDNDNDNDNHNHDNDYDNHDHDHLQARAKTGRRLALRASDSSPPGR